MVLRFAVPSPMMAIPHYVLLACVWQVSSVPLPLPFGVRFGETLILARKPDTNNDVFASILKIISKL